MGFKIPIDPFQKAQEIRKYCQMVPFCEMIAKKTQKTKKQKQKRKNKKNGQKIKTTKQKKIATKIQNKSEFAVKF